jgi:hypothetical protein
LSEKSGRSAKVDKGEICTEIKRIVNQRPDATYRKIAVDLEIGGIFVPHSFVYYCCKEMEESLLGEHFPLHCF